LPIIENIVKKSNVVKVRPEKFFVSWHGVIVLAYEGFPEPLCRIKQDLNVCKIFKKENPGALWPKTSLAVMQGGIPPLTYGQFRTLYDICEEFSRKFNKKHTLTINSLKIVLYSTRDLNPTNRLSEKRINLAHTESPASKIPQDQINYVKNVLYPFSNPNLLEEYWKKYLCSDQNRIPYYTKTKVESTLISDLKDSDKSGIGNIIKEFKETINNNNQLRDKYEWFDSDYLHLTVRGLV